MESAPVAILAAVDGSEGQLFVAAAALVTWVLAAAAIGIARGDFPAGGRSLRIFLAGTTLLVLATAATAGAPAGTVPSPPWAQANGDLANTRMTRGSEISSANIDELGITWSM